ncbi:MAG: hypothetical protein WBY93_14925, partial [Candidatus Binatus sp.]
GLFGAGFCELHPASAISDDSTINLPNLMHFPFSRCDYDHSLSCGHSLTSRVQEAGILKKRHPNSGSRRRLNCETFTDPREIRMASAMHYLKVRGERP